ncbi:hypothetical protein M080_6502, partial [Bacteroides fragilis str. 3397 T10]
MNLKEEEESENHRLEPTFGVDPHHTHHHKNRSFHQYP